MFTEEGAKALWQFIFIVILAEGANALTEWLFDFEVAKYVFCFFLLTYMVNNEKKAKQIEIIKEHLRPYFSKE